MLKSMISMTFIFFLAMFLLSSVVHAGEVRTTNRTVEGDMLENRPSKFPYHLSPNIKKSYSNWDSNPAIDSQFYKYRHHQQWKGMDWDSAAWPENVKEENVLSAMYHFDVFRRQYVNKKSSMPVVEIGSGFYKLSDLDRRRSLKLVADYFDFFENGFVSFEVRDWRDSVKIGDYNRYGFQPS